MRGKKEKIYSEFLQVSNKTGVPINKVRDMFWYLSRGKAIENNRLLQMVGVSKNALNQVKNALSSYLESATRETKLQGGIAEKIQRLYGSNYATEEMLLKVIEGNIYRNSIELLAKYRERRPTPKREYDQFTATVETTARRVSLLNFFADVKGKRMVFLGDDDFTSIATANLRTAQNVTVVDIDSRILDEIEKISRDNNLGIKLLKYDATKLFPNQLKGQFDMVFTDPPYTPSGVRVFLARAIEALDKRNKTARIYICYGNSDRAKERFLPIQEVITSSGLTIRWVFDKFNRYQGAESIGSSSSLFVTEITSKTKPLIKGNYDKSIYTFD